MFLVIGREPPSMQEAVRLVIVVVVRGVIDDGIDCGHGLKTSATFGVTT